MHVASRYRTSGARYRRVFKNYLVSAGHFVRTWSTFAIAVVLTPFAALLVALTGGFRALRRRILLRDADADVAGDAVINVALLEVRDHAAERIRWCLGTSVEPRFRRSLRRRWGTWVWINDDDFKINNHVTFAPYTYRGRPISDDNLQEFVSSIISQQLPIKRPPWCLTLITTVDRFYVLVRCHHSLFEHLFPEKLAPPIVLRPQSAFADMMSTCRSWIRYPQQWRKHMFLLLVKWRDCKYKAMQETGREMVQVLCTVVRAPGLLFHELTAERRHPRLPRSGRHVVAWSDPISLDLLHSICFNVGGSVTVAEVLLAATACSLREFYRQTGYPLPPFVAANLPIGETRGFFTVKLPIMLESPLHVLRTINKQLASEKMQPTKYLASSWLARHVTHLLPTLLMRKIKKALTRKYPVSIRNICFNEDLEVWGLKPSSAICWSPPQANTDLSLSLITQGNSVLLAVMADVRLAPAHASSVITFRRHALELAAEVGITHRERLNSRGYVPRSPAFCSIKC